MKIIKNLFSPAFMGILFVVFAISMAAATFIENDSGSAAAYSMIYNTRWFELIMLLLSANLIGQAIIHKLFRKEKLPVALFHLSFVLMVAGAGITRYFGWEGSIHIREGETSSTCYSGSMSDSENSGIANESKITTLPFSLRLDAFIMERYPGSSSPSGYKSNVTVIDKAGNVEKPFTIFMNNILKYKGYRFYQSSFDKDEKGTVLSVSHDPAGMLVTYTGYALLFLSIILSLISRNSQFRNIKATAWSSPLRKGAAAIL
jgi:cytochrome c biogenesis protein ResB